MKAKEILFQSVNIYPLYFFQVNYVFKDAKNYEFS